MRSRTTLFTGILTLCFVALPHLVHAGVPFFGPIIDPNWRNCPISWGGIIIVANNIISFLITMAIVVIAPIMIGWSGFLMVINPANPSAKDDAKTMLWHTVLGIVIALASYMIVAAVMATLTKGEFATNWQSLISGNRQDICLNVAGSLSPTQPSTGGGGVVVTPPAGGVSGVTVTVGSNAVVSDNAVNVLKGILAAAGLTSATITSGRRTSADQARIMYTNIEQQGVASQKSLYGSNGDAVIDVYVAKKDAGLSADAIKAAMQQKIDEIGCANVSNHCTTGDVFDVAPSSIGNDAAFRAAVQNSSAVKKYIFPPTDPAYHIELL